MALGYQQLSSLIIFSSLGIINCQFEQLGVAQARFAVDLMGELCGMENCVFSPYSMFNVLSMLTWGAKGETADQMMQVLQGGGVDFQNNDQFHQLVGTMKQQLVSAGSGGGVQFSVADDLFVGNVPINPEYQQQVQEIYNIFGPQTVDFGDVAGTLETINQFVSDATNGEITDFLNEQQITPQTIAVLVNAIFFKGNWKHQFDENKTHKGNFSISRRNKFEVDMMQVQGEFRFTQSRPVDAPKFEILELLYENTDFAMNILKPFTSLNLARESIQAEDLLLAFEQRLPRQPKPVLVQLPKFQISVKTNIDQALRNLGMTNVFDVVAADLSGLAGVPSDPVYVSSAVHEAKVEVNEKGTKASAATGVGVVFESSVNSFQVDQPFMFTLVHKPTNATILIGQVIDPRLST